MPYLVPDRVREPLYVIAPIFNPVRYKNRWKLYQRFAQHVVDSGAVLVTIEAAFGHRELALADSAPQGIVDEKTQAPPGTRHQYIGLRTFSEIWLKENLINLAIAQLPADWKYVAWVDADVTFARPNWVGETIHQLQHYQFVQMFSEVLDLKQDHNQILRHKGFVWCWQQGMPWKAEQDYYYGGQKPITWHPGFAWAARREAIDSVGGLVDFSLLGAGDNHMAHALIGEVRRTIHPKLTPGYVNRLIEWQRRCDVHIRRNIGYVEGLLLHYWHGKKKDRRYRDRWKILVDNLYNPDTDIKADWQGMLQLQDRMEPRSIKLRDEIRKYFRERNEDSTEI